MLPVLRRLAELDQRRFTRAVTAFTAIGFVALAAAVGATGWVMGQIGEHGYWVEHTYRVELAIDGYRLRVERMETARRGYLLVPLDRFRDIFWRMRGEIGPRIDALAALTADNPRQRANVAKLRALNAFAVDRLTLTMRAQEAGHPEVALAAFKVDGGIDAVRAIRTLTDAMNAEEHRLMIGRDAAQKAGVRLFYLVLGVSAALLAAVAILSIWVIRRYTHDLAASRDALSTLNEGLEEAVAERTVDLRRANDEIQRFAYIVSHDLRSPLVNVLGFTAELDAAVKPLAKLIERADEAAPELVTPEARLAVQEDVPEAIGFIRSSTQKMDRLINAILTLSRQGRRTITPERIDMGALAQGVADSLKHRTDELGAQIAIAPIPNVVSDRLAVEQILSNLVENAVKYLQPGRPGRIRLSGAREGARVIVSVADNGRGIDPRDHDRVFDLFRRSGAQDQPGEGIGLAHVRALAYRLGGIVDCVSALGEGATFRLSLPETFSGEAKALS